MAADAPPRTKFLSATAVAALAASGLLVTSAPAGAAVTAAAAAASPSNVLVWSGSTAYTDNHDDVWQPASGFVGGSTFTLPPTSVENLGHVTNYNLYGRKPEFWPNDPDNRLWGTGRVGVTGWSAPVANGRYRVELRFLDPTSTAAGQRAFRVTAEGTNTVVKRLDILDETTTPKVTIERTFNVTVADGVLNLAFTPLVGQAVVSSIRADKIPTQPAGTPGSNNTGPTSAGSALTQIDAPAGGYILNQPGRLYEHPDINGIVVVSASNVTLRDCFVRGDDAAHALIHVNTGVTGFVLEDCTVAPTYEHLDQNGIEGFGYTVRRCEIRGTTDAADVFGDNVRIEYSWLHDTRFLSDGNRPSHNDGVQVQGGSTNIVIDHNTITGNRNAALQIGQDVGSIKNVVFSNNWVDDGGASVNVGAEDHGYGPPSVTVTGNTFWRHQWLKNCAILYTPTQTVVTASGKQVHRR